MEERILDFLDGNLGSSEEEELLHRLAVSPERRNLLKQHLQMRELTAALARNSLVTVPKVLTASLFTALAANGYAGPSMPSAAESLESIKFSANQNIDRAAENIIALKSTRLFSRSSLVFASAISFIIGAAVLYFITPEERQEKFAASVSSILQAQRSAEPLKAEMANMPTLRLTQGSEEKIRENVEEGKAPVADNNITSGNDGELYNSSLIDLDNKDIGGSPVNISDQASFPLISNTESKYPPAIAISADIHGSNVTAKNPFDPVQPDPVSERSFMQRLTISFRGGEGKAPGNEQALTGSLMEIKASYDISDLLVAKISVGQFMPYETEAVTADPGFNADGFRLLQLKPVMQYRAILGAELGAKFTVFDAPFEVSGGFISDFQGSIIPRLGFFTSLSLQDNLSMNLGLEGMIYSHDISSSLRNAQNMYAGEHPSLIGVLENKESTGFIGPAIELMWHF